MEAKMTIIGQLPKCVIKLAGLVGFLGTMAAPVFAADQVTIYVTPGGDDHNNGLSSAAAVSSLGKAVEVMRGLKQRATGDKQFIIELAAGVYRLNAPLNLDARDSGTSAAPTIIQGAPGGNARITGTVALTVPEQELPEAIGRRIPQAAREHVAAFNLKKNNVADWVGLQKHGFNAAAPDSSNELFINEAPLSLAAWPKSGYQGIAAVPDGKTGQRFGIADGHAASWAAMKNVWAVGYWGNDWADEYIPVGGVAEGGKTFTLTATPKFGIASGQRVRFENVPEELDGPGRWYYDYDQGVVYAWVDNPKQPAGVELSIAPVLIHLASVQHLQIKGLRIDGARGDLIDADAVQDFVIDQCIIRNSGKVAVHINGSASGVTNSQVQNAGGTAISLAGGDRKTLQPGKLFATRNVVFNFGRIYRSYQPAVYLSGVGNVVEHNRIYNAPHQGIIFTGNDHSIAYNEIYNVDIDTGDAGAIYGGRDWTGRGTQIKYNYLHNIHGVGDKGATGVYVDDQGSGTNIEGNVFFQVYRAVLLGGGLDNSVVGNIIVKSVSAIHLDARGTDWEKKATDDPKDFLQNSLRAVPYQQPVYLQHYPQLATLAKDGLGIPRRNAIKGNVIVASGGLDMAMSAQLLPLQGIGQNLIDNSPGFARSVDWDQEKTPATTLFQISGQSKAFAMGFKQIPLDQIGP
jgi:hypothetical protein